MERAVEHRFPSAADRPPGALTSRSIAEGEGWSISQYTCTFGPRDRPFEERHDRVAISTVIGGSFRYRTVTGRALMYPGSFLLGNAGACYECGHDHDTGDRCVAFHYAPSFFEEIAASAAGSYRFRFANAMLPALKKLTSLIVSIEAMTKRTDVAVDELAIQVAETVLTIASGAVESTVNAAPKDQRRISDVLHFIEEHAEQPLDLAALAAAAFMSKYHFLRTFRRTVGVTPHQFLLGVRLRRAGVALRATSIPVATIAFEAGFGDLSTFNHHFRKMSGMSPSKFRAVAA